MKIKQKSSSSLAVDSSVHCMVDETSHKTSATSRRMQTHASSVNLKLNDSKKPSSSSNQAVNVNVANSENGATSYLIDQEITNEHKSNAGSSLTRRATLKRKRSVSSSSSSSASSTAATNNLTQSTSSSASSNCISETGCTSNDLNNKQATQRDQKKGATCYPFASSKSTKLDELAIASSSPFLNEAAKADLEMNGSISTNASGVTGAFNAYTTSRANSQTNNSDDNDVDSIADDNTDVESMIKGSNNNFSSSTCTSASSIADEHIDPVSKSRSVGCYTDTEDLGPCEPGKNILLEGIIWNESCKGVLILNVSWRGKNFVGSLIDSNKSSWAAPRFKEFPKFKQPNGQSSSSASYYSNNNRDPYSYYGNYGPSSSLYNLNTETANCNGINSDPTVRTLRNGKRRYITQNFENELMSEGESEANSLTVTSNTNSSANSANGASSSNASNGAVNSMSNGANPGQHTTSNGNQTNGNGVELKSQLPNGTGIKMESSSSASSVNDEEFDTMTQSSSSSCSGKSTKLTNSSKKSKPTPSNTTAKQLSTTPRSGKKSKKSIDTSSSSNDNETVSKSDTYETDTPSHDRTLKRTTTATDDRTPTPVNSSSSSSSCESSKHSSVETDTSSSSSSKQRSTPEPMVTDNP